MELDKMIEVLKAYQEGKVIEMRPKVPKFPPDVIWVDFKLASDAADLIEHQFNFDSYEYRIKRVPYEEYRVVSHDGTLLGRMTHIPAKTSFPAGATCYKMVEDITWEWK